MSIKTINFLPSKFRSDTNQKFLNATMDQLVTPPDLRKINGYVGRTFAPTFKSTDNYQPEPTAQRQDYQLEPSIVVKTPAGSVDFFSSYIDLLQQIGHEGGLTDNQSRLFASETYSFDGLFDFDKIVNFNQYYWLPNGPDTVEVFGANVDTERTFVVTRDPANGSYNFSGYGTLENPTLKLAHGGTYKFIVNQPGYPMWLQSYPGVDGRRPRQKNISTRTVVGVDNNGIDQGIITFTVPQTTAQDYYTRMPIVATVDFSTDASYTAIQGQLLSTIVNTYNGFDGSMSQLVNKTLVFVNQEIDDIQWTLGGVTVPLVQRRSVWKIALTDNGSGDSILTLVPDTAIANNQRVYIKGGIIRGELSFYLDPDAQAFIVVPDITAPASQLFYQDAISSDMVGAMDMVAVSNSTINVTTEILGRKNYTSPNGVTFTNGLKVTFDTSASPNTYDSNTYYVDGVGSSIRLLPVENFIAPESYARLGLTTPDYITINRSSLDLNAWSRSNRWFHIDVIQASATYNNTVPLLDQTSRAARPIIEFDADIQLFNYGRVAMKPIDIIDFVTTDAFNSIELENTFVLDGVTLVTGMRVVFANDFDPQVRDRIYVINIETINNISTVNLVLAEENVVQANNAILVLAGTNNGKEFYFNGYQWIASQAKAAINQLPLFDVVDSTGTSISDSSVYPGTTFVGTPIFTYKQGTGSADTVLGFPLSYRNFNQIGDIQFTNNFDTDTFSYIDNASVSINQKLLRKTVDLTNYTLRNIWIKNSEKSRQFQIIQGTYKGVSTLFEVDITANLVGQVPYLRIYKNSKLLDSSLYSVTTSGVRRYIDITDPTMVVNDHIDILIYSDTISELGYYEIPKNLDFNTENKNFSDLTLGQMRNHLVTMVENSNRVSGTVPGNSNLRDLQIKQQGGSIMQHASPVLYSELFLVDKDVNFLRGLDLARHEYSNFKNKFLELALTTPNINLSDAPATVDILIKKITAVKNKTFSWFYSDMVPYGDAKNVITYDIINAEIRDYELTSIFSDTELSNRSVLVYINNVQLILGFDYSFDTTRAGFTISSSFPLNAGDTLTINEYSNTDGNYIPETPTKLGLYPKFTPQIYLDDTYQTATMVIQGHDGSITPAFGDFRDNLLLELEKRIYNNIKVNYQTQAFNLYDYLPGKFRIQDYSHSEFTRLLSSPFLKWTGSNRVDFTNNSYLQASDPFTWNYRRFQDSVNGEQLTGAWRSIFKYMYDTDRPHTNPWEMLGFSEQPDWWELRYGPAPYTGGNMVLWTDLAQGFIYAGPRAGIDSRFARPVLTSFIPVDEYGQLRSPDQFLVRSFNSNDINVSFAVGDQGPVETAWRRSSDYPFAVQHALALSHPAYYFGTLMNVKRYYKNTDIDQYVLADTFGRITPGQVDINGRVIGSSIVRAAGYVNWIAEYLRNVGIDPVTKISGYLDNVRVQLAYKMAGYSDPKMLEVIAEQSSPTSTNSGVVIPAENYDLLLYKSTPIDTIVYSAVIIEKSGNGYTVSGYNQNNPYFTIIPSMANNNAYGIKVNKDTGVIYNDFQNYKLTVPYGFEFTNKQQIVDFLISYERYLRAVGMQFTDFDTDFELQRDFKLSVREFLNWSQQGWKNNNILVLSPVLNKLTLNMTSGTVDEITNSPLDSRLLDTGFGYIKNSQFTVIRNENQFSITANYGQTIALAALNVVEFEHVLIFDNTTVFNDIIYKPELGNRQYRLKLVGHKTGSWTGIMNPPGFVYNNPVVELWLPGNDYAKGSLVSNKGVYYAALADLVATVDFVITDWRQVPSSQIKNGLLPNFSYNAQRFDHIFDIDNPEPTMGMEDFSQAMIGFSPRQYMTDFGIDKTTQAKFYQGFIREKGTTNSVTAFTAAGFNGVTSTINLYEEWGMRVGEYGALENNQYVEIPLTEGVFTGDPSTFTLLPVGGLASDRIIGITPDLLYRTSSNYAPAIYRNRDASSIYDNDIRTSGYVNSNDVNATIFNIGDYKKLNAQLANITIGFKIWCAKNRSGNWDTLRVTETNAVVINMTYNIDNIASVTVKKPASFTIGDIIAIKGFDDRFDGFYQVYNISGATSFDVVVTGNALDQLKNVQTISGTAPIYRLQSSRLQKATDLSTITPAKTWRDNDKLWVDNIGDGTWAVYNKSTPWSSVDTASASMSLSSNTYVNDSGFGSVAAISIDSRFAAASLTAVGNGNVAVFVSNVANGNILTQVANLGSTHSSVTSFGASLDIKGNLLYIGNPGNGTTESGRIHIHSFDGNTSFPWTQTLRSPWSSNVGDQFGYSISASEDNAWLFVGAPNKGNVYVYHANISNYYTYANTITVGSNTSAAFGSIIKTTSDASQTIIAAPYSNVNGVIAAGTVYVYDRSMETFAATGVNAFLTQNPITSSTLRVTVDGALVTTGFTSNTAAVTFANPLIVGTQVTIETSKVQLMETLVAPTIISGTAFGTAIDISGNDADIYVSSPGYSEPGYHSGIVYRFVNAGERYGSVIGTIANPVVASGDSIRINGRLVTFGGTALSNVVSAINSANIVGITSSITSSNMLSINSSITSTVDKLIITPGNSGNVLTKLGIAVYSNAQTIKHLGNDDINGFGTKLSVNPGGNALIISGPGSTTYNSMPLDASTTIIDTGATTFLDPISAAGAVYIYGLVGSALSGSVADQMVFVQRLQNTSISANDKFGTSLASSGSTLLVGAPGDDNAVLSADPVTGVLVHGNNTGTFYTYNNFSGNVGWDIIDSEMPQVDISSITRLYLFDTVTNTIMTNLDHIDPAKGKLLGVAEQDIDYWTAYDPAVYNVAGNTDYVSNDTSFNLDHHWGVNQLSKTWWNLDLVRFVDYEQGSLSYRANNWGGLFPGSVVQIAEWVQSNSLPSQYTGNGTPLYADNSAYVTETYVDTASKIIRSRYYYWVINKNTIDTNVTSRTNSVVTLESMITNPHAQGIPYAAVLRNDTISLHNISNMISGNTTVLHIDYDYLKNDNIIHSEYQLVQEGNNNSDIPARIINKLRDSLAGRDQFDALVPNPALAPQDNVGIDRGQSIFIDRITAVQNWVEYVNNVLYSVPACNDFIIDRLYTAEPQPIAEYYDLMVSSYEQLSYINTASIGNGYVVLVDHDETQQSLWATYTWNGVAFLLSSTQSYYTPFYWSKIDWYASDYDHTVKPSYQVATLVDIPKLTLISGNTVKVVNNGQGQWEIYRYDDSLTKSLVGLQAGTIKLNSNLYDGSTASKFEIRVIFDALESDLFKESLAGKFNEMFFFLMNFILSEQKTVDWIFKSSFVSIVHQLRKLEQFPNYIKDNQTYYESYINEVKPYRTSLREYLLDYQGSDVYTHDVTDFDIPSTYDAALGKFRSPDMSMSGDAFTLSTSGVYRDWYQNYGYGIGSIEVVHAGDTQQVAVIAVNIHNAAANVAAGDFITQPATGANGRAYINSVGTIITLQGISGTFANTGGYLYKNNANLNVVTESVNNYELTTGGYYEVPKITVVGGGGTGANIVASIDATTNTISGFTVIDPGRGFTSQPTININGTGTGALAYAHLTGQNYVESLPTQVLTLSGNVTLYAGNVLFQPNTAGSGTVYADAINSNVVIIVDTTGPIGTGNLLYTADANLQTSVTSINSYTQFIDKSYNKIRSFDTILKFDRIGYDSVIVDWASNVTVLANTVVRYNGAAYRALHNVYSSTSMKINGNITANVGDYITQSGSSGNAKIATAVTSGNVVAVANISGVYLARGGNLLINGVATMVRPASVTNIFDYGSYVNVPAADFDNANDRIMAYYSPDDGMPARQLTKLVAGLEYPGVNVQGVEFAAFSGNITSNIVSYNQGNMSLSSSNLASLDFTQTEYAVGQVIRVANLDMSIPDESRFKIVSITNDKLLLSKLAGNTLPIARGSNVSLKYYDFNNPIDLDSSIQSSYLDTALGTRAEDINITGGAYYDTFSSHAPEELVPGQVTDHLNMSVYTKIYSNTKVVAYRIVSNAASDASSVSAKYWPVYYTIANTAVLTANLNMTDLSVSVNDASQLAAPDLIHNIPGRIYINGEQIIYWRNYATDARTAWAANSVIATDSLITYNGNVYLTLGSVYATSFSNVAANVQLVNINTLAQLHRGVDRTGTPVVHPVSSVVEPIGDEWLIPTQGNTTSNVHLGTWLSVTIFNESYITNGVSEEFITTETGARLLAELGAATGIVDGTGIQGSDTIQAAFIKGV